MSSNRTPTALEAFFMLFVRSNGSPTLPQRPVCNFLGFTISDDPDNNQTIIAGGGGSGSLANLTANFTQPAVDAVVVAQVTLSSSYAVGTNVAIFGGGFYDVSSIPDSTHLTLKNLGSYANAAPGATISSGALVIPSGPPNTRVQANGADITQREILDIEGLAYSDTGSAMKFVASTPFPAFPVPPPVISAAHTIGATETFIEFQGTVPHYDFDCSLLVPGRLYLLLYTGGTLLESTVIRLTNAPSGHPIEQPDNRSAATASTQQLGTSWGPPYHLIDDGSVLRAWRG